MISGLLAFCVAILPLGKCACASTADEPDNNAGLEIRVSFGPELGKAPLDGRLLVMLSKDAKEEPRFQVSDGPKTQQIFGIDVDGLAARSRGRGRHGGAGLSHRKPAPGSS